MPARPMRPSVLKSIETFRALLLLTASLGITLLLDPHSADATASKNACFATACGLLTALSAMKFIWGGGLALPTGRQAWALFALFATVLLAYAMSPSLERSQASVQAWCLLFLLLLLAFDWLQLERNQERLLFYFGLCLALACAWGLLQALGIDLSSLDKAARLNFGNRISSRLGNPNFFAGFLILTLPAALYLRWRWLAGLACILVLLSGSKAAWLGLGFQYLALGHLHWHSSRPLPERQKFFKRWAAAGLLFASVGLSAMPHETRARLLGAFDPRGESVQFRIQTWKGALAAFEARPWLGHGPGSFSAVYPQFRPPAAMAAQLQHSYEVTHAENWPLQMAVEYGLLGLAALLVFFFALGKPLWKAAEGQDRESGLALCLVLSLGGSLACNLASLDLFLPSSFWFFSLALALGLALLAPPKRLGLDLKPWAAVLLSLGLLFCSLFPALRSAQRWRSQRLLLSAEQASQAGHFDLAIPLYERALRQDAANTEALYFLGASELDQGQPELALKFFVRLQKLAPDYVLVHDKKARAYKALGKLDDAAAEWERQLALDPWFLPGIQDLSSLYAQSGNLGDAVRILEAASLRFPERSDIAGNLKLLKARAHGR